MLALALNYNQGPLQLSEISLREEISEKYLGQISIQLRNARLIDSVRGAQGGYLLASSPEEISIKEIVEVLEGDLSVVSCVNESGECNRKASCVTNQIWEDLTNSIINTLSKYQLNDLVDMYEKQDKPIMYYI